MAEQMIDLLKRARLVSVPLVVVRTQDQQATVAAVAREFKNTALLQWDAARGYTSVVDDDGKELPSSKKAVDSVGKAEAFEEAMLAAQKLPQGSVLLVHNAHRQLSSSEPRSGAMAVQAVANLRDQFKQNFRMLVLLAPVFAAPPELEHDLVVLDHALPGEAELAEVIAGLYDAAKLPRPEAGSLGRMVEAVSGLSSFAAEQVTAMSLRVDGKEPGVDISALWERKRVTIEQTRGLRVWRGAERFGDLVGLESVKARMRSKLKARTPIGCVVFLDEIDKVLANVEQDTSGVRMDQLRTMLTEMENNEWRGLCCVGVPGGGKSALAKAFGNEAGVPTIALDLGDMEGPHVGESEAMMRHAMQVIKAIGRGNAYVIATSNNYTVMRPELQRRFTDGFFFFDVMSAEERAATWKHYVKRYELSAAQVADMPDHDGWTGAEIRNCCREAWDTGCTLREASAFVVPMARSRATEIEALRRYANGRFLDANAPGPYRYSEEPMQKQVRAIALPAEVMDVVTDVPKGKMN